QILADDSLTVVGNQHISAANHLVSAAGQVHLSSKMHVVIDAGMTATLKAGGQWINITPLGIFSSVPMLLGGMPMPGMPAVPGLPTALVPKAATPAIPSLIPSKQIKAIAGGAPFCRRCAEARQEQV
ncbi:hypothetical protein IV02_28645, partial [Pseudomonas syringae]